MRDSIRLKPDDAQLYYNLGNALALQGKFVEAEGPCRKAIRLKPTFADAHIFLGLMLDIPGRNMEETEKEYREGIRLKPDSPTGLFNFARFLDGQGRRKEARVYWEKASKVVEDTTLLNHISHRLAERD